MIITNISKLLTMEPLKDHGPLGIIENAFVEIDNGKISAVIASEAKQSRGNKCNHEIVSAERPRNDIQIIDAKGGVVIPGLIDCHTHLVHAGDRSEEFAARAKGASYEEIARAGGGIMSTVRATRVASEDELFESAKKRAEEFLSFGVATIEVKSGYGLDFETELKMLRVVKRLNEELPIEFIPTFLGAHAFPSELSRGQSPKGPVPVDRRKYIDLVINKMIPAVAKENLAKFCDVFVENIAFTKDEARKILKAGLNHGLKPKLHVDQITADGGAGLAAELGAISADHLDNISKKDMVTMASAGVTGVLIPTSTLYIGGKYAPAKDLIKAGVNLAISTDYNPGSSPVTNIWMAANTAIKQMGISSEDAYKGITINAARALDMDVTHGSIAIGKVADLVILNAVSEFDPLYKSDKSFVKKVIKRGKVIYQGV